MAARAQTLLYIAVRYCKKAPLEVGLSGDTNRYITHMYETICKRVIATALHSEIYLNICTVHKDHSSELTAEKYTELIFVTNNTFLLLANLFQEFY